MPLPSSSGERSYMACNNKSRGRQGPGLPTDYRFRIVAKRSGGPVIHRKVRWEVQGGSSSSLHGVIGETSNVFVACYHSSPHRKRGKSYEPQQGRMRRLYIRGRARQRILLLIESSRPGEEEEKEGKGAEKKKKAGFRGD